MWYTMRYCHAQINNCKKIEKRWDNIKNSSRCIIRVPERENRAEVFEEIMATTKTIYKIE